MTASIRLLSVLAALAFSLPASASETAAPAAQPEPATSSVPAAAAETATAPAAPTASTANSSATAAKTDAGPEAVTRVPAGYKAKVVKGETMLCRKSTPLGSRFPTEVCMTTAQYEDSVRQSDGLRQELTGKQKSYHINQ